MSFEELYYFAHNYTCKDGDGNYVPVGEEANFRLACIRAGELIKRGYNIYSPICHTHPIHIATPEFLRRREHKMWYELDNRLIARTDFDGIILPPFWWWSEGVVGEKQGFEDRGKRIRLYNDILKEPILPQFKERNTDVFRRN